MFSEAAQRSFQLWPTETSPALLVSGFLMHRIRDVAPHEGAARMVRALGKLHGSLLDTTTGLGYAAIFAAQHASGVTTVEVQPAVRELARQNPWSAELFDNPKIQLTDGDSSEVVPALEPASFSAILHDLDLIEFESHYVRQRRSARDTLDSRRRVTCDSEGIVLQACSRASRTATALARYPGRTSLEFEPGPGAQHVLVDLPRQTQKDGSESPAEYRIVSLIFP